MFSSDERTADGVVTGAPPLLVSVVVPAFNAAAYIRQTVESVIGQTYRTWELIVVDDGSTDDTQAVLAPYKQDQRISIVEQDNAGVSAARNRGLNKSRGAFIAFLDADDVWERSRLEQMITCFERNPDAGLVHTDMGTINAASERQEDVLRGKEGNILDSLLLWDGCNIPSPSSILLKRDVLERVGGFNTSLSTAADQEFFFRVASQYQIRRIPAVLGFYRIHDANMHSNIALMEKDHIRAYQCADENGFFRSWSFRRRCYSNLYLILAGSWWKNGHNRLRGMLFALRSVAAWPPKVIQLFAKLAR